MIPEIRKFRMYLAQLEPDLESMIEQACKFRDENVSLKRQIETLKIELNEKQNEHVTNDKELTQEVPEDGSTRDA